MIIIDKPCKDDTCQLNYPLRLVLSLTNLGKSAMEVGVHWGKPRLFYIDQIR